MTEPRASVSGSTRVEWVLDAVSHGEPRSGPWLGHHEPHFCPIRIALAVTGGPFGLALVLKCSKWGNGQAEPFLFLRD
jgi:hypothetical protein